jgi:prevent-host-death family protein
MHQVDINEAKTNLSDLVKEAMSGVEVVITKDDQPIVKLVPLPQGKPRPHFGSGKSLITMADDFEAPLADFDDYMR